jgi:putative ABC transport system permease protein
MFGLNGKINSIIAVNCLCYGMPLSMIKNQIQDQIPGIKVVSYRSIAQARLETRHMMDNFAKVFLIIIAVLSALTITSLLFGNARARKNEVGMFAVLGFTPLRTGWLFAGRAVIICLLGGLLGCAAGYVIALWVGPRIVQVKIKAEPVLYLWAFAGAVGLCLIASIIPIVYASRLNPGQILREE